MSHDRSITPDEGVDGSWTAADEELVRAAFASMRDDVALPLMDPRLIRARYRPRRRRRVLAWTAAAAAAAAAAVIGFSQLGPDTSGPLAPAAPTHSPVAPTPTRAQTPTPGATAVPGTTVAPCNAVTGEIDDTGVNAAQRDTAERLMAAAVGCDAGALIEMTTADDTQLSFGVVGPEEVFALPPTEEDRFGMLTRLLSTRPQVQDGYARWPAEPVTGADWQRLVDADLITSDEVQLMEESGIGYVGFRVVIDQTGRVTAFLAGD